MTITPIRLSCSECLNGDHDGITPEELAALLASGWTDVEEVQSYEESCRVYDDPADAPPGYSIFDWETHVGVCPHCAAQDVEPDAVVSTPPAKGARP